jgi:hypothetical protein
MALKTKAEKGKIFLVSYKTSAYNLKVYLMAKGKTL